MTQVYDEKILSHYRAEAAHHGDLGSSTMSDLLTRKLETDFVLNFISRYLKSGGSVVDVGCGNGFTLAQIRSAFPGHRLTGLEFTPDLRAIAEKRFKDDRLTSIVSGDIREPIKHGPFDALICQRVIINLLIQNDQHVALRNIANAVAPGGYLVFIEALNSPLNNLNAARAEFDLPALGPAIHNLYLEDNFFEQEPSLKAIDDDEFPHNFLSSHYFVSRVLHPVHLGQRPFVRNSHFVKFLSAALPAAVGDYSPVQGRVFRKAKS